MTGNNLQFTLNEYKTYIRMSGQKHLLVEGRGDKRLFKQLLLGFNYDKSKIDIDSAEELIGFETRIGNRERVEATCRDIQKTAIKHKLVGFVDREFRGFDYNGKFVDRFPCHHSSDGVIWTRGHSIENYYFDFDLLHDTLGIFSKTIYFDDALEMFQNQFDILIRLACAASLAGRDTHTLSVLKERGSIQWKMFKVEKNELTFDKELWKTNLLASPKMNERRVNEIIDQFSYWFGVIQKANFQEIRWMCHGHVGLSFIFAFFGSCIYEVCRIGKQQEDPEFHVQKYLWADDEFKFNSFATAWVQKSIANQTIYPSELLKALQVI